MNESVRALCPECGEEKLTRPKATMCLDCEAKARVIALTDKFQLPTPESEAAAEQVRKARAAVVKARAEEKAKATAQARKRAERKKERTAEERAQRKQKAEQVRLLRRMQKQAEAEKNPKPKKKMGRPKRVDETAPTEKREEQEQIAAEQAVQRELAQRELARRKLIRFILRNNPKYKAGWVHIDICERLEKFYQDVIDGNSPRLMLFVPPRHGKSMICSQEGPAWFLGKYPDREIITSSYSEALTLDFSHKVQERVSSPDFAVLFPNCKLKKGRESLQVWRTTKNGGYVAAGVGGPLTGRGCDILLIDDPLKNRQEADSQTIRDAIWKWYTSTAYTRLMPGGGVLIIQTRWHDDDLSGRALREYEAALKELGETGVWPEDADKWEVVSYPAIATEDEPHRKQGEALHPERFSLTALKKIRRTLGPRDWAALYQQTPTPEEGEYFTKDMLKYYRHAPPTEYMTVVAGVDLAISKADHANYSVICVAGVDARDDIYVLDVRRGRWDSMEIIEQLFDTYRTWRPQMFGIETGQIEKSIKPFLDKRIREERLYGLNIEPMPPGMRDKLMRARPIQGRMKQGKVWVAETASWTQDFVKEALRFPNGVNDDQVDALAWVGQMMSDVSFRMPKAPKLKSWKDKLGSIGRSMVKNHMAA